MLQKLVHDNPNERFKFANDENLELPILYFTGWRLLLLLLCYCFKSVRKSCLLLPFSGVSKLIIKSTWKKLRPLLWVPAQGKKNMLHEASQGNFYPRQVILSGLQIQIKFRKKLDVKEQIIWTYFLQTYIPNFKHFSGHPKRLILWVSKIPLNGSP